MQEYLQVARAAASEGRVDHALDLYDRAFGAAPYYDDDLVEEALNLLTGQRLTGEHLAEHADRVRRWIDGAAKDCDIMPRRMRRFVRVRLALGDLDAAVDLLAALIDSRRVELPAVLLDEDAWQPLADHPRFEELRRRYEPTVVAERIDRFAQHRLRGRPIPADLRAMLTVAWSGRSDRFENGEIRFFDPGERSGLEKSAAGPTAAAADAESAARDAAWAEVFRHVAVVGTWQDGAEFGYWLHPDEPDTGRPAVVQCDSEGQWTVLGTGCSLAEALVGEDGLAAAFREQGIAVLNGGTFGDHANRSLVVVHPEDLYQRVYAAQLARAGSGPRPTAVRPTAEDDDSRNGVAVDLPEPAEVPVDSADLVAILGRPVHADHVVDVLRRLGLPETVEIPPGKLSYAVSAPAHGIGMRFERAASRLPDPQAAGLAPEDILTAVVFFHADGVDNHAGYPAPLPYGLRFDQSRTAVRELLGTPRKTRDSGPSDEWDIGPGYLTVDFTKNGQGIRMLRHGMPLPARTRPAPRQ